MIKDYQGKHNNAGLVLASGSSLHFQNTELFKKFTTVAVNAAIRKYPNSNYFLSDDVDIVNWDFWLDVKTSSSVKFLYSDKFKVYENYAKEAKVKDVYFYKHRHWNKRDKDCLVLNKDIEHPFIGARNSAGSAINLLHCLGCSPIVLLGTDCCYIDNKKYYWEFSGERKVFNNGHSPIIHPSKSFYREKMVDSTYKEFLEYWEALAVQAKSQNIEIIDASMGLLDCFVQKKLENIVESLKFKHLLA